MKEPTKKLVVIIVCITLLGVLGVIALIKRKKMTRGLRNNNPFNIRTGSAAWLGKIGVDDKGFCVFSSLSYGIRAGLLNLYNGYFSKNMTVRAIINKYAPSVENNVEAYLSNIKKLTGIDADIVPKKSEWIKLALAIMRVEQGSDVSNEDELKRIIEYYSLIHWV